MSRVKYLRLIGTCWAGSAEHTAGHNFPVRKRSLPRAFFMLVIPLIILVYTHLMTFWLHRNEEFRDPADSNALVDPRRRKIIRRAKMKSLRISLTITLTFLAYWTPYYVLMIASICIHKTANEKLKAEIFFFGMSTSLFNSLIYGLFHEYRPKKRKSLERKDDGDERSFPVRIPGKMKANAGAQSSGSSLS